MMRLFKKTISILMILTMVLSVAPAYAAETTTTSAEYTEMKYLNEINELKAIGIIDYDLQNESLITRGEFAHLLVRFMGVDPASLNEPSQLFYDVPITHKYFQEISYCARQGYMLGYGNNIFQPDKKLVAEEVFKPIITALGYGYKAAGYGSNTTAYIQAAKEIGMINGITVPYGENLFSEEVAKIFHNLLEIPMVITKGISADGTSYTIDPNKTVLSEMHKMARHTGVLVATDIAGISGYSATAEDTCVIDGVTFNFTDPMVRTYLGYKIDFLYSIDEITLNDIIICQIKDDMNKLSVFKEDVVTFRSGTFAYINEYDKVETVKVPLDFEFIYNGKNQSFDDALIENAKYGYYELLSSEDNSTYDIVKFYDFKTLVVDRTSLDREFIQGSSTTEGMINYDSLVYKTTFVDTNGNFFNVKNLRKNDVIAYIQNGNFIYGIVSRGFASGVITELNTADSEVFIDGVAYKLSGDKMDLYTTFKANLKVSVYIDCFGNIARVDVSKNDTIAGVCLPIKLYTQTEANEKTAGIKVYDFSLQNFRELLMDDYVEIDGTKYNSLTQYATIESLIISTSNPKPVVIKTTSKDMVRSIETAKKASEYGEGEDGFTVVMDNIKIGYYRPLETYYGEAYTNILTTFFIIPDDITTATADEFKLAEAPKDNTQRYVSAFTNSKDNVYSTLVLYAKTEYYTMPSRPITGIIKRITESVTDDGDKFKKIYINANGEELVSFVRDPELVDIFKPATGTYYYQPDIKLKDLKVGDIISYVLDDEGYIVRFNCHWKAETNSLKSGAQTFASSNRYAFVKEVLGFNGDFMKVKLDILTASKLTADLTLSSTSTKIDKVENLKLNEVTQVMVIDANGNSYESSIAEICAGDQLLIYSESYRLKRIFIIKD